MGERVFAHIAICCRLSRRRGDIPRCWTAALIPAAHKQNAVDIVDGVLLVSPRGRGKFDAICRLVGGEWTIPEGAGKRR